MYKTWILIVLLGISLLSVDVSAGEKEKGISKWKGNVTESDLVRVVNFLINNKGKEIDLAGKHKITGKERLDIEVAILECCSKEEFNKIVKTVSTYGKVKQSNFPSIHASVAVDAIPKIDEIGIISTIKFEPEAHSFWMKVIK